MNYTKTIHVKADSEKVFKSITSQPMIGGVKQINQSQKMVMNLLQSLAQHFGSLELLSLLKMKK